MMNQDSSRSHSIFTVTIEATERFNAADAGKITGCVQHAPCILMHNLHTRCPRGTVTTVGARALTPILAALSQRLRKQLLPGTRIHHKP